MKTQKTKFTAFIWSLIFVAALFVGFWPSLTSAQGTGFHFQGRLNDGTNPANGHYDLQFQLFDAIVGGNPIASLIQRPNTVLINGVFSTTLDFGPTAFNNPNIVFIEISVKPGGSPNAYTILGPRQQLTVVPFAVRAMNSTNADNADLLNGINSSGFIRNSTTQQPNSTFNIQGFGRMGTLVASNDAFVVGTLNIDGRSILHDLTVFGQSTLNGNLDVSGTSTLNNLTVSGQSIHNAGLRVVGNTVLNGSVTIEGAVENRNNVTQNRDKGGTVKAMLYVNQNGTIRRCYNGITGSSTGNCGFTVTHGFGGITQGEYVIDFGFQVSDRFISIVPEGGINVTIVASFVNQSDNRIQAQFNISDVDHLQS